MPITKVINGDLLNSNCSIIAHQCNCLSKRPAGLSAQISKKYPAANPYKCNNTERIGTIDVISTNGCKIINMFAQYAPGKSKNEDRLLYFKKCLDAIDNMGFNEVAMPYMIGCGLAGGNWDEYKKLLNECKTDIVIYKLN